ncbi:serine/threonine protein kinase, partial [Gardnerella vaginalis]
KEFAQSLEDCLENYLGDNLDSDVEGIENIRSRVNHYKNNRRDRRKSSRRSIRKNSHKKSSGNTHRNIVIKIICCILMVIIGCFLIGTSLHSLTSNSQINSRKNDYAR